LEIPSAEDLLGTHPEAFLTNRDHRRPRRRWLRPFHGVVGHFQRTLGAGILVILPIGVTVLVLKFFFDLLDPLLQPAVDYLPGREVTGLGLVALVLLVYVAGLIAAQVLGRRMIGIAHRVMELIPVIKSIYGITRTAVDVLSNANDNRYSGVVLIDFPRAGIRSIGLVTSRMVDTNGNEMLAVFIPSTPMPTTGFLVIAPATEVTPTDMTVEEAMKMIISGGILSGGFSQRL
jgi:uncharacterized membrane protein